MNKPRNMKKIDKVDFESMMIGLGIGLLSVFIGGLIVVLYPFPSGDMFSTVWLVHLVLTSFIIVFYRGRWLDEK